MFEAMGSGGSQGWPGCRRGYRRDCPGYYTPEKVYILYTARVTTEGPQSWRGNWDCRIGIIR